MNLSIKRIRKLYYKDGLSAREVGEKVGSSVWQVMHFMKKHRLPRRSPSETIRLQFLRKPLSFNIKKSLNSKEEKLRIAGIMLYWAEGNKQENTVDLANSDPKMIKIFLNSLREICQVDEKRLRAFVYCYANQNTEKLESFWSKITKIPRSQFQKTYVRKDYSPTKKGKMKHGLVHIRYNDQRLVTQIKNWIDNI